MLECWSVGVLECWSVGVLECWSVGVLECWSVGVLECYNNGYTVPSERKFTILTPQNPTKPRERAKRVSHKVCLFVTASKFVFNCVSKRY